MKADLYPIGVKRFRQVKKADPEKVPSVDSQNITQDTSMVRVLVIMIITKSWQPGVSLLIDNHMTA